MEEAGSPQSSKSAASGGIAPTFGPGRRPFPRPRHASPLPAHSLRPLRSAATSAPASYTTSFYDLRSGSVTVIA